MTQLLVLGLLDRESLSGYDIQLRLQISDAESWGGVLVGSIYHALKKLESSGCIEVVSVEQTGRRKKAVYGITENGRKQYREMLVDVLQNSRVSYPTDLYSGLNFIDSLDREQAQEALKHQKKQLEAEKKKLASARSEKEQYMGGELPDVSRLVFEHMEETIEQQIRLLDKMIAVL